MGKLILLLLLSVIFIGYVFGYVTRKFGLLKSISASYYKVPSPLFSIWIAAIAFLFVVIGQTMLIFLAGGMLCYVAVAPAFLRIDMERAHIIGAVSGIVLGFASMILDYELYYLPVMMIIFIIAAYLLNFNYRTFWIEVAAFILIITGLFINHFNS
jgi:hypothetical protein